MTQGKFAYFEAAGAGAAGMGAGTELLMGAGTPAVLAEGAAGSAALAGDTGATGASSTLRLSPRGVVPALLM